MFDKQLTRSGHSRRFIVDNNGLGEGWEVRIEHDSEVVERVRYTDWHRVERALTVIEDEVSELEELGWAVGRRGDSPPGPLSR